jgi:hypothetical protein
MAGATRPPFDDVFVTSLLPSRWLGARRRREDASRSSGTTQTAEWILVHPAVQRGQLPSMASGSLEQLPPESGRYRFLLARSTDPRKRKIIEWFAVHTRRGILASDEASLRKTGEYQRNLPKIPVIPCSTTTENFTLRQINPQSQRVMT